MCSWFKLVCFVWYDKYHCKKTKKAFHVSSGQKMKSFLLLDILVFRLKSTSKILLNISSYHHSVSWIYRCFVCNSFPYN